MKVEILSKKNQDYRYFEEFIESGRLGKTHGQWLRDAEHQNVFWVNQIKQTLKNNYTKEEIESAEKLIFNQKFEVPTKFDSLNQYLLLNQLIDRIKNASKDLGYSFKDFPYFVTIPTKQTNAYTLKLPQASKPFLIFDQQLFLFCNLFSKAFAISFPKDLEKKMFSDDLGEYKSHISKNKNKCVSRIYDVLEKYNSGQLGKAEQYMPDREYMHLASSIRDGMELMIVGHELGHYIYGHLDNSFINAISNVEDNNEITSNHKQEYEADYVGFKLALKALNLSGEISEIIIIAVEFFFTSMILYHKFNFFIKNGYEEDENKIILSNRTHPSLLNRRKLIRNIILNMEDFKDIKNELIQRYSFYDSISQIIWDQIKKLKK